MTKVLTIPTRKAVKNQVNTPSLIGKLIADLVERGLTRDQLAEKLDIKPSSVSILKHGKSSLDDSKLSVLAELHGGYTARQLKILKYLEWLEREKGITADEIAEFVEVEKLADPQRRNVA